MPYKEEKRILVVEDVKDMRERYVKNIKKDIENIIIDESESKAGAIEQIRRRTYHVALLDIMLMGESQDRGGIEVLDYIKTLNEGTLAIMLSGAQDIQCAIHSIRSRIVVDYIHKIEIRSPEIYINPLKRALQEVHIPIFGKYGRLTAYLAAPEKQDVSIWEHNSMNTVSDSGFDPFHKVLSNTIIPLSPILPLKEQPFTFKNDKTKKALYGAFWSKAIGSAVWICINSIHGESFVHEKCDQSPLLSTQTKSIKGTAWVIQEYGRDHFLDSLWQV